MKTDIKVMPVIMSGGAGSRLWPASRQAMPKQLLALVTDETMVQETGSISSMVTMATIMLLAFFRLSVLIVMLCFYIGAIWGYFLLYR